MMHRNSIFWGILLVLLGGLFLLENMGLLPQWINVWGLIWPLLLIGLGVQALIRATNRGSALSEETVRLPLEEAAQAQVRMYHGAGELRVDDRAGADELLNGTFTGGVEKSVSRSGSETRVDLRVPSGTFNTWFDGSHGLNWTVGLSPQIPLRLELEVGASRNWIDLRNLQVKELRLSTGASASTITFPEHAGQTTAWLKSGAASVEVSIPQGVAARIRMRGGLASMNVDALRFPRIGDEYQSADYATAENRLDLDVETGVGSVSVR
jgi:hypothetical protein